MKNNSLQTIKKLIDDLPEGYIPFAKKYVKTRDFESLELLVKSAIKNIERAFSSGKINEFNKYKIYIEDLNKFERIKRLNSEVASYNEMLGIILGDDDNFDEPIKDYYDLDSYSEEDALW